MRAFERKIKKREEAEKRQAERSKRSDKEQLDLLIARGAGHCQEAKAIRKRLGKQKRPKKSKKN